MFFYWIFTDGSKEPKSGNTGFAFVIPELKINIRERTPDHLTVFTVELLAILNAVQWVEHNKLKMAVICSDSLSALVSLQFLSFHNRPDIVYEIYEILYRLNHIGMRFMWIPVHKGIEGNDMADVLAKQALKQDRIIEVSYSKAEIKAIIRINIMNVWQKQWDEGSKGCHLYKIRKEVGKMKSIGRTSREQTTISRMRLGHTGLNKTMYFQHYYLSSLALC